MKIALVILHAESSRGGAERYTIDLAAGLARRGHDVHVLASSFSQEIDPSQRVLIESKAPTRTGRYERFLDRMDAHLDQHHYEIVHAMLPVRRCDIYHPHAGMAADAMRKSNRFFNPRRVAMAKVEADLLNADRPPTVMALSEYVKKSILRSYSNLPPARLATVFNAVDLERFQPAHAPSASPSALIIANDFERKGLEAALRALALVGKDRLKLVVAGKQPVGRFASLSRDLNISQAVTFHGPAGDPRPLYAAADFFVLPTKHDPCSLVVLEALAMGLPVISTKFNGACEIMTDGVHGYVLDDPTNVEALADAMRKLLDPDRRANMSRACLELRPSLSYQRHLDRLEEIYQKAK